MSEDESCKEFKKETRPLKRKLVSQYSRGHLHRNCKLVIQDTGESLFAIERQLNVSHRTKRAQLPKLPPEIWIKIFSYIIAERQYPFMIRYTEITLFSV